MADGTFKPDFLFSRITNVSFGNQWFFVWGPSTHVGRIPGSFEIDFPDQAGGTPGLIPVLQVAPAIFAPYLPTRNTVKSSDLTQVLTTKAGAKVTAFGFAPYNAASACILFFKLGSGFPSSPFRVRVTLNQGAGLSYFASVGTLQKNFMKAGAVISFDAFSPAPPVLSLGTGAFAGANPHDFLVNPSTLKVTGPL